jgi:hypothetical protein
MSNPPTERDLLLAILAMDSYNRGYDRGIEFEPGVDSEARIENSGDTILIENSGDTILIREFWGHNTN